MQASDRKDEEVVIKGEEEEEKAEESSEGSSSFDIDDSTEEEGEDYDDFEYSEDEFFEDQDDLNANDTDIGSDSDPDSDSDSDSGELTNTQGTIMDGGFRKERTSLADHTPMHFRNHTTAELIGKMNKQCQKIAEILAITQDDAINLLQHFSWNSDKLMEEYMSDQAGVRKEAGLTAEPLERVGKFTTYTDLDPFECFICCEDTTETYKLACNHEYCTKCYKRYAEERLVEGRVIKCPDCDLALQIRDIDNLCGEGSSIKLLESSIKEYIERLPAFKWCPAPDCTGIVEVLNFTDIRDLVAKCKIPVVKCDNNHQFCCSCLYENHSPAPCQVTKNWISKCRDDSETVKWIMTNTKTCPKCDTSIEKNGGCNHMTCKKCRYEFCWICSGDWAIHGTAYYNCNRFGEKEKVVEEGKTQAIKATKESLKRYLHYYNLFSVHEVSTKLDMKRCSLVEETVRELQIASGISWIEAQFIADSAMVLLNGRRCLKWSYPLAYYCDRKPYLDIFENVQNELSMSVESLSKLFEIEDFNEIVTKRKLFLDACGVVITRQNAILSCMKELIETKTIPKEALELVKSIRPATASTEK